MPGQTEWELIDDHAPRAQARGRALLGPWWRWKLAALAIVSGFVLALLAVGVGLMLVAGALTTALTVALAGLRQRWAANRNDRAGIVVVEKP